jgi:hypothetical protein
VSTRGRRDSRRDLFAPHASEPRALRRCPICQWVMEQDHAEALAMHAKRKPDTSRSPADLAQKRDAQEAAAVAGFALV